MLQILYYGVCRIKISMNVFVISELFCIFALEDIIVDDGDMNYKEIKGMKKQIRFWMVCGVIAVTLASCSTKQSAINKLEKFSYELRDNSRYYDLDDWEKAGKKFVKITKEVRKHELDYTPAEKARIGRLEGECAGYMARGAKDNFSDRLRGFINELKGILQGVTDAFGK